MSQMERTPLLCTEFSQSNYPVRRHDVYDRFTANEKRLITLVISMAGIIGPFAPTCFVPCVPAIAHDLKTSGTVINYTVGVYNFMVAVGNLVWAPYSAYYGRQPIYMISLPIFCVGSIGAALSQNVVQLAIGRALQAFGASSVTAIGAATISDIYRLEERGTAMGLFFGSTLLGPALAPLIGGVLTTYYSWRVMQFVLFAMGLSAFISVTTLLTETSHPGSRGVDRLVAKETSAQGEYEPSATPRWKWVWLNPLRALRILRGPVILLVSVAAALVFTTYYALLVPLPYTLGPKYGITSPALIGASFIPSGVGSMVGAVFVGRMADYVVIQGRKRRMGKWVPEDRLRATLPGVMVLIPLSLITFGISTSYLSGKSGLVISLVCLFTNSVGADIVLAPCATYLVDILRDQSAEAMAVYSACRSAISAIGCAGVTPMLNAFGSFVTNGLAALLAWVAFGILCITIKYGDRLRAWINIGYTHVVDVEEE